MMTTVGIMSGAEKPKSGGHIPAEPGVERSTIRKQLCDEWQTWCSKYRETNPDEYRPLCKRQFETYCNPDEPKKPKRVFIPVIHGLERYAVRQQECENWQEWCSKYRETDPAKYRLLCKSQLETYCNPDESELDEPNPGEPSPGEPIPKFIVSLSGIGPQIVPLIPEYPNMGLNEIKNPKIKALEKERLVEICKFLHILNKTPIDMDIDMDSLLPIRFGIGFLTRTLDHYVLPTDPLRIKLKNISLFIVENSESVTEKFREDLSSLLEGVDLRCEPILEYVNRQSFLNFVKRGGARRKQRRTRRREALAGNRGYKDNYRKYTRCSIR